ncbi:MAG: phosphoglycerate kinase [Bacilli bacterium]|nr:phosphoglycerate kinase [Bacilli bacterium]
MKRLEDMNIKGKRVIIRCDYNVPIENGIIKDDTRIVKSLKTINYCIENASKVVILSHLGRIKSPEDLKNNSLKVVCDRLSELLNKEVKFITYEDDVNKEVNDNSLVMLENVRYFDLDNKKESNEDPELSKYFASFGDIFINEGFGVSHRECSSLTGISKILPSCNGFLVCEEVDNLSKLLNGYERPYTVCMGGKKVSDKIELIDSLIDKCDYMLISGLMVYTFLAAKGYKTGKAFTEEESYDYCISLLEKYPEKIVLIKDAYVRNNGKQYRLINEIDDNDECLDIGPETIELFKSYLEKSKTIFINGPVGLFEDSEYEYGSKSLCEILKNLDSKIYAGGGETTYMFNKYGVNNAFKSTGGGATLTFLSSGTLIGIIK